MKYLFLQTIYEKILIMKKFLDIDSNERQRILEMHQEATKKNYLNEQDNVVTGTENTQNYRNNIINTPTKIDEFIMKNIKNCQIVDSYVAVLKSMFGKKGAQGAYYACKGSFDSPVKIDPEEKFVKPLADYLRAQLNMVKNFNSCDYQNLKYQSFWKPIPKDVLDGMTTYIGPYTDKEFKSAIGELANKKFIQLGGKCVAQKQPTQQGQTRTI